MIREATPVASVLVWHPPAGTGGVRHLRAGDVMGFGACECRACGHDVVTRSVPAGYVAGRFRTGRDHWRLDNLGDVPLTVRDVERPYHPFVVPTGRLGVAIPFELSEVLAGDERLVTVFGPEPRLEDRAASPCPRTPSGQVAGIDRRATYFVVLVALCEPWLRTGDGALPSYLEIARTLGRRGLAITPRAVEAHIDYLVDKLRLRSADGHGGTRAWRKEALASAALRRGLVGPEHLPATAATRPASGPATRPAATATGGARRGMASFSA